MIYMKKLSHKHVLLYAKEHRRIYEVIVKQMDRKRRRTKK